MSLSCREREFSRWKREHLDERRRPNHPTDTRRASPCTWGHPTDTRRASPCTWGSSSSTYAALPSCGSPSSITSEACTSLNRPEVISVSLLEVAFLSQLEAVMLDVASLGQLEAASLSLGEALSSFCLSNREGASSLFIFVSVLENRQRQRKL